MKFYALSFTKNSIPYIKELKPLFKSVTSVILGQQLDYWFHKYPNGFYKYMDKPDPEKPLPKGYRQGDSWCEELGFSKKEFRKAFDNLGIRYKSLNDFKQSKETNPFIDENGKEYFYCSVFNRVTGITMYYRNHAFLDNELLKIFIPEFPGDSQRAFPGDSQRAFPGDSQREYTYTDNTYPNITDQILPLNIENKDCFPNKEKDLVENLFDYGGIDLSPNKPQESPSVDSDAQIPSESNKPQKNSKETPKETVLIEGVEYQIPKNRKIRVGRRVYHCPKYYPQQFIDLIYFTYPDDSNMVQAVKKWDQKCKEGDIEEPDFELIKEDILWRIDNDPKWLDGFVQNPQTYLHNLRWNETKKTAVAKISSSQSFKQQERDRTKEIFRKNAEVAKQIGNPLEEFAIEENKNRSKTIQEIEDEKAFGVITLKPDITGSYSPFDSETEI